MPGPEGSSRGARQPAPDSRASFIAEGSVARFREAVFGTERPRLKPERPSAVPSVMPVEEQR